MTSGSPFSILQDELQPASDFGILVWPSSGS